MLLQNIAELMRLRKQRLYQTLNALKILLRLTEENKHLLFRSKLKVRRRHSADSSHEVQYEEREKESRSDCSFGKSQSDQQRSPGSGLGSDRESSAGREERKIGANNYMLQSVYDAPVEYCTFLKYLCKSYTDMCVTMKAIEPICTELVRQASLTGFEPGNFHKTIFFNEIWNDQIVSVLSESQLLM